MTAVNEKDDWPHCPHYGLGPADRDGVAICSECGASVQLRLAGHPVEEFYDRQTTVTAREGEDVAFDWPGEG
jgi:hypothetical protein